MESNALEANLRGALSLIADPHAAYLAADHRVRRLMNQAIFEQFLVDDDESIASSLAPPFSHLITASQAISTRAREETSGQKTPRGPVNGPFGLSNEELVELSGLEPLTSWVRCRRSPAARQALQRVPALTREELTDADV
jgi:hypothetical protein